MDWSKIFCIELRKYNDTQLSIIESKHGVVSGLLSEIKQSGTLKLYVEEGVGIVAGLKKKELWDKFDRPVYKGLVVNHNYLLSKKDKDKLLKIEPTEFNTKKN